MSFINILGPILSIIASLVSVFSISHNLIVCIVSLGLALLISSIILVVNIKKKCTTNNCSKSSNISEANNSIQQSTSGSENTKAAESSVSPQQSASSANITVNSNGNSEINISKLIVKQAAKKEINKHSSSWPRVLLLIVSILVLIVALCLVGHSYLGPIISPPTPTPTSSPTPTTLQPTSPSTPTLSPSPSPSPTVSSMDFVTWWNDILHIKNANCMLPFKEKADVYPSKALSKSERHKNPNYCNACINNKDKIVIEDIVQATESDSIAAYINYPIGKNSERKNGYVELKTLINISADTLPSEQLTTQTTAIFNQPKIGNDKGIKTDSLCTGRTIYLLSQNGDWQQILYNDPYGWQIKWVKAEELKGEFTTCTINESAHVRQAPSTSSPIEANVYANETYAIHETIIEGKLPWYFVYAKGHFGWVCSTMVSIN